jgi:TldD protein
MELNDEIADYAVSVASKSGMEYSEAYLEYSNSYSYAIEQGIMSGSGYLEEIGLRIRMLKNKRLYTFSTNILDKGHIRRIVGKFKNFKGVDTEMSKENVESGSYKTKEKTKIEDADMLKDLVETDKALADLKHLKNRMIYGGMGRSKSYFTNSEGSKIKADVPSMNSFVVLVVGKDKETRQAMLQFGAIGGYENFKKLNITENSLERSKSMYEVLSKGVVLKDDELKNVKNVVISPEIAGIAVHESIGHPNEADRVFGREAPQAGTSYISPKNLGLEIGSEIVNIFDDPTIDNSFGFYLYDDEGVKAQKKHIIKNGRQNELLINREYGKILGIKSNASARSDSYSNEPLIRMSNSYLGKGNSSFDELVKEARNGVYIKSFMEWNIDDTRTFSRYQGNEAYLIKNGSLEKPIKNYKLESSTTDFWHAVKLLGKDFGSTIASCGKGEPMQGVSVSMGGPSALLSFGD